MMTQTTSHKPDTIAVHGGQHRSPFMETSEALFLTSGYVYDSAQQAEDAFKEKDSRYIYSRFGNPTVRMFEEKMALLGGSEDCWATASGMAAVFASLMCQLQAGNRVVAARELFGSCDYIIRTLLPAYGITSELVAGHDMAAWKKALAQKTHAVFFETPSNPTLSLVDMEQVSRLAHDAGAMVIVDNVFASSALQNPFAHGADIVVYSTTKHIDGQGRCLGGAILATKEFCQTKIKPFIRNTGPSMSPFNAWVMTKSLETLALRVEKASHTAAAIADQLARHPAISTIYPHHPSHPQYQLAQKQMSMGSTLISFEFKPPLCHKQAAYAFLNELSLILISNNLGDSRSLAVHPATTTHHRLSQQDRDALGISDGLIRLSIGLEDGDDLLDDINQALAKATQK